MKEPTNVIRTKKICVRIEKKQTKHFAKALGKHYLVYLERVVLEMMWHLSMKNVHNLTHQRTTILNEILVGHNSRNLKPSNVNQRPCSS
jgi:hypothetical protein